jgi:hypothetical protein
VNRARKLTLALAAGGSLLVATSAAEAAPPCGRTRFITIYDSHGLTPYGEHLDGALLDRPEAELTSFTLGGASPSWLVRRPVSPRGYVFQSCQGKPLTPRIRLPKLDVRTPDLDDLLRAPAGAYDHQVVILTLGSNVPGEPWTQTPAVEQVVRTIRAHKGAICIWVGPPALRNWSAGYSDQVYAAIRDGIRAASAGREPACHLVDSRRLTVYPAGGDGTHLGFSPSHIAAAQRWAEGVEHVIDQIVRGAGDQVEVAGGV